MLALVFDQGVMAEVGEAAESAKQPVTPSLENGEVVFAFTGDISFAGRAPVSGTRLPVEMDPLVPLHDALRGADFTVANLECVLTQEDFGRVPGHPSLWAPPVWVQSLVRAGVDLVGLANNHAYDGGGAGLLESLSVVRGAGLRAFGAGATLDEARRAYDHQTPHGCVAFIPAATFVNQPTPEEPGRAAEYRRRELLFAEVQAARERCAFVVVYLHGGPQYVNDPSPSQRRLARRLVESGAHLVVAHHPHVLQGVEFRGESAIAYSLGNLVFRNPRPNTFPTGVLRATVDLTPEPRLTSLELVPAYIDRETYTPHPAGARSRRMTRRLGQMSRHLGTRVELVNGRIRFSRQGS